MALNLGGVIRLTYAVKDSAGALVNPATITLTITQPDGTNAAGITVTNPPAVTGQFTYDFTPTQAGRHEAKWLTTGPASSEPDVFYAEAPGQLLISVDDAVEHLNASGVLTSDVNRERLQWLCIDASAVVARDLDRVLIRSTIIDTFDGGGSWVQLRSNPVISVTSVVEAGTTLTAGTQYVVDKLQGLVRRGTSTSSTSFTSGWQNIVVTYVAGYADPPKEARKAALNLVQAMWQTSQQQSHPLISEEFAASLLPAAVEGLTPIEQRAYKRLKNIPGVA